MTALRRVTGGACALLLVLVTLAGCAGAPSSAHFTVEGDRLVSRPSSLPLLDAPSTSMDATVTNSSRGQYQWMNAATQPPGWPTRDLYWRDQLRWGGALERSPGKYDFSSLDAGLERVARQRGRLGFRVMAWCPGCGGVLAPSWLPVQPSGAPDWNSEAFLSAWEKLMAALGQRYAKDPRIAYVDMGGYGAAGEWYQPPNSGTPISTPSARRMMTAVLKAFPNTSVLVPWLDGWPEVAMSLKLGRVGIRNDCVGADQQVYRSADARVASAWRTALVVGEWCNSPRSGPAVGLQTAASFHMSLLSSGNRPTGYEDMTPAQQREYLSLVQRLGYRLQLDELSLPRVSGPGGTTITTTWTNSGTAPTYDRWRVVLLLRSRDGDSPRRIVLTDDLRRVVGARTSFTTRVPQVIARDSEVSVVVEDATGYLDPMRLAVAERQADGSYPLGRLPR